MQKHADRMIRRRGNSRTVTLRRFDEVPDTASGDTAGLDDPAETIIASVLESSFKEGEFEKQRFGDVKLIISGSNVPASPPIDGSWTGQLSGESVQYPIVMPVKSIVPDGNVVIWHACLRKGAAGAG